MSGLLNKLITNGAVQEAGTIPGTTYSSVNIRIANPLAQQQVVKIWATTAATPGNIDLLEPGLVIPPNGGRFEQSCLIMSANEKIFVEAAAGLIVRIETVDEE